MPYRAQIDDHGVVTRYKDTDTGELISAKEYERRLMMQQSAPMSYPTAPMGQLHYPGQQPGMIYAPGAVSAGAQGDQAGMVPSPPAMPMYPSMQPGALPPSMQGGYGMQGQGGYPHAQSMPQSMPGAMPGMPGAMPSPIGQQAPMQQAPMQQAPMQLAAAPAAGSSNMSELSNSSLIQQGAQRLDGVENAAPASGGQAPAGKTLRMEGVKSHQNTSTKGYKTHGFLDATSIAILLPTLVLLALIIAAAHKKRLFPWQTIRTFNPPSGLMTPRDYERSYVCPPNLRRHGRLGKRNPNSTWVEQDGIVLPFGFLARTHLPITIPLGRLPNKNMFIVAPSGSGKTTLMRAIIKALMAKPCVVVALEAKANDPSLDEKRESFKHTLLPEAQHAGFDTLYFNPLDPDSVHWNPLDLTPIMFASSIVQDVNSLPPEEQHWAERDHGYIGGLTQLLKWGAVMVAGEDENGQAVDVQPLPCNPRGLMRLVNNRRNIVESLRRCKTNPNVPPAELSELTQTLSSIIRTDSDWDKNIQGVRGRLRMFKNPGVLRCTEASNIDIRACMHKPTVLIFGAPASMGPDAESLASCFVYQMQNALHSRYGTASVLPLFAFFDEYQTLNMDIAGRLSAIVRGANGGLTIILQNIAQIAQIDGSGGGTGVSPELKTIFSNSAIRVCLHNTDESTAKFFSDEIGKHAIIVPGISDHYDSNGFGIFPSSWNRIHSQQVVARVDSDSIKRMEKHHALVFLSPAGDPEFGELKPFICDLRGIEEIARLHLLHNVQGRNPQEGEMAQNLVGDGAPLQPGSGPQGAQLPPGAKLASPVLAAMLGPQNAERAAQLLGAPQQALTQGASMMGGPGAMPQMPQMAQVAQAAVPVAAGVAAGAFAVAAAQPIAAAAMPQVGGPRPPFPGVPSAGVPTQPMPGAMAPSSVPATGPTPQPAQAQQAPGQNGNRACAKCGKWPGKGRFCIECGTFVGQPGVAAGGNGGPAIPAAYPAPAPTGVPTTPQPAQAAAPVAGRTPLTSLHGDLNKYGVPAQAQGQAPEQQPGQTPMPRPQARGGGIEF